MLDNRAEIWRGSQRSSWKRDTGYRDRIDHGWNILQLLDKYNQSLDVGLWFDKRKNKKNTEEGLV